MTQQVATRQAQLDTGPGMIDTSTEDLVRAADASTAAQAAVSAEERRARVDGSAGQQQRIEDAQRDLIAAEAFEGALEDGQL